jgi:protein-tyrosine-phosphatase
LAEALLKKLRPDLEVDSAGVRTAIPIPIEVREYLTRENAARYLKKDPESLDSKQLNTYDVIVAMEQKHKDVISIKCPECTGKVITWNIEDPYFLEHEEAKHVYDQIRTRVTELATSLQTP